MDRRGLFVVFEGPEGAGKSTCLQALAAHLTSKGRRVVTTREPGGTPVGDAIRSILLDPEATIAPRTEFLLYASARAQHVDAVIEPALRGGSVVLCDRYAASSVAYQSVGRGLDRSFVDAVNEHATHGIRADLTVLLDVDPEIGLGRVARRGERDRLERADVAFHRRVRQGFLDMAAHDPSWHIVDATAPLDEVTRTVLDLVDAHVTRGGQPLSTPTTDATT